MRRGKPVVFMCVFLALALAAALMAGCGGTKETEKAEEKAELTTVKAGKLLMGTTPPILLSNPLTTGERRWASAWTLPGR